MDGHHWNDKSAITEIDRHLPDKRNARRFTAKDQHPGERKGDEVPAQALNF
jgi:hypothetical protein